MSRLAWANARSLGLMVKQNFYDLMPKPMWDDADRLFSEMQKPRKTSLHISDNNHTDPLRQRFQVLS